MDTTQIVALIIPTVLSLVVGIMAWGIKNAINTMTAQIEKNAADVKEVQKEVTDLKSDLPLVYVLREDFLRTLNNVDKHIGDLSNKVDNRLDEVNRKIDRLISSQREE